ncbi:MarR family winged helix-turn-helix transcriptional regulator [Agromyces laixinhei]|uniref:MarR family winged helix-turn-helix transcriptional regulator n=1 Tax=Agromyces laixinhei TaxID=2585717 RepID=UPI0012EDCBD5|nr:MarR family transcriptional regulator [Agromyces laixinhei]
MTDPSPGSDLSALQRTAWIRFAIVAHGIPAELNSRLLADSKIGQFEFLVLNHLKLSDGRSMAMSRLAVLMASSPSRLSHVVARLETDGRVRRSRSSADGRAVVATLTDRGDELYRAAAPGYFAAVRELFFDRLDETELAELDRLMAKVLPGVDGGGILAPLPHQVGGG